MHICIIVDIVNENLRDYFARVSGGQSIRSIALDCGIEPSTLTRQLSGEVKVQIVVQICRHYGAPLLPAFVAAGFITQDEADSMGATSTLSAATDKELAQEILRRASGPEEHEELTRPLRPASGNVTQLRRKTSERPPSVEDALARGAAARSGVEKDDDGPEGSD